MVKRSLIMSGLLLGTIAACSNVVFGNAVPREQVIVSNPQSVVQAIPTSASIQVQHVIPGNPTSKSVVVNKDFATILYQLIEQLPPTTAPYYGAADHGVRYQVTFVKGNAGLTTAEVNPTNTGSVAMNGKTVATVGAIGNRFWSTLATVLGVNVDQLRLGTVPIDSTTLLDMNPTKVILTKNEHSSTLTSPADMNKVVAAINDVAQSQDPTKLHCLAITNDHYRIQIFYGASKTRSFHNDGGSCLPLVDEQSSTSFQEVGTVLTLVSSYIH